MGDLLAPRISVEGFPNRRIFPLRGRPVLSSLHINAGVRFASGKPAGELRAYCLSCGCCRFCEGDASFARVKSLLRRTIFWLSDLLSSLQINAGVRYGSAKPVGEPRSCCFTCGSCRFCKGGANLWCEWKVVTQSFVLWECHSRFQTAR